MPRKFQSGALDGGAEEKAPLAGADLENDRMIVAEELMEIEAGEAALARVDGEFVQARSLYSLTYVS